MPINQPLSGASDPGLAAVHTIFATPSGRASLREARPYMDVLVTMHLGRLTVVGRGLWCLFVMTVDRRRRQLGLEFLVEAMQFVSPDVIELTATLELAATGATWPLRAQFRVRGGKVVEIWSLRRNYVALFGEEFEGLFGPVLALRFALPVLAGWLVRMPARISAAFPLRKRP